MRHVSVRKSLLFFLKAIIIGCIVCSFLFSNSIFGVFSSYQILDFHFATSIIMIYNIMYYAILYYTTYVTGVF